MLHDVFTDTAARYPHHIAISEENGPSITYHQLNLLSNRLAHFFSLSKGPQLRYSPYIGILSTVHSESIAAVLACLKAGCAYVPLDEHSPSARLSHIISHTSLDTLVIEQAQLEKHRELCRHSNIKLVLVLKATSSCLLPPGWLSTAQLDLHQLDPAFCSSVPQVRDNLAYILHTSGSTGIPKGIMLTHRNARTFVDWMHKEFVITPRDVIMSRAPFKFDLSVFDIFNTFKGGAKLICFDWNKERPEEQKHRAYVELMEGAQATVLYTTPSTFIALMHRGGLGEAKLHLSRIMYAGEPFPVAQLRKLMAFLPHTRIANIYGPTETNIITYYWIDHIAPELTAIPLGHVVDDTEILVVSEDGQRICQPEELGELWCRGGTVSLGYLGMAEKTRECLVQSPFHPYPCLFWRTGDYGWRDAQGLLHYRGRRDNIIKVKGYRIEIGEIEQALAKHPAVDEAAIVALSDEKYGHRLFCFFSTLPHSQLSLDELKQFLLGLLPPYMLPYAFSHQALLPKTSSGKIDRQLLQQNLANFTQPQ